MIKIASKDKVFGMTFNTLELIEALKNPLLDNDEAPIGINTQDYSEMLTLVYKCNNCDKLHLVGGELDYELFDNMIDSAEKVYINKTMHEGSFVTKKELLYILESIPEILKVGIETFSDDGDLYTLASIFKCSETCPVIHLDSAYDEHNFKLN